MTKALIFKNEITSKNFISYVSCQGYINNGVGDKLLDILLPDYLEVSESFIIVPLLLFKLYEKLMYEKH